MADHRPRLDRRALVRGTLSVGVGGAVSAVLAACTSTGSTARTVETTSGGRPDTGTTTRSGGTGTRTLAQELEVIPQQFFSAAEEQGTLVELSYGTYESMTYDEASERLTKRAIVYLPFGYDGQGAYDVLYLMHGGWGDETTTLGTPSNPLPLKNAIDHAIGAGEITPLIIVCPTYNNTSPDDSADFGLALTLTQNYHQELLNDLIPAVERRYSSFAEDVTPAGLAASRDHRGFGGFSMGAVATWRTFEHGLDYFRDFLPMSCGTSLDMDNVLDAARARNGTDYFVLVITGTDDFAYPYDEDRIALMRTSRHFVESDSMEAGNFAYRVKDGYAHDGLAAMEYTYNGLRWFWGA